MRFMTAEEVADLLRIPKARAYELAREGLIPHLRLGTRQVRFNADALEEWIARGGNPLPVNEAHGAVINA
jgi:excisionase family DNA binding protein